MTAGLLGSISTKIQMPPCKGAAPTAAQGVAAAAKAPFFENRGPEHI
jgi:hypothetical protein